jgi:putative tryptophan/tyrosine transport system substrate-binding protein
MRRREFVSLLGGAGAAVVTWPLATRAQPAERVRRVGVLIPVLDEDAAHRPRLVAFMQRLQVLGWTEGRNLQLVVRFAGGDAERMRISAAQLVAGLPDVIVSSTSTAARALVEATREIPIVMAIIGDPVALGFTTSMSRPTGNLTGFTTFNDTVAGKRLEILREVVPTTRKVGLMWVPANPQQVYLERQTRAAAATLGLELLSLPLTSSADIAPALARVEQERADALLVAADPLTITNSGAIIDGCLLQNLPAMHTYASEAHSGALLSYGNDVVENFARAADYVDRLLKGAKVSDLPFEEPTRIKLMINLRTARSIGLVIPPTILARADEVIE